MYDRRSSILMEDPKTMCMRKTFLSLILFRPSYWLREMLYWAQYYYIQVIKHTSEVRQQITNYKAVKVCSIIGWNYLKRSWLLECWPLTKCGDKIYLLIEENIHPLISYIFRISNIISILGDIKTLLIKLLYYQQIV